MLLLGSIICIVVGMVCVVLGWIIWKKQKVSLIHEYHWKKLNKEKIPAYTKRVGIGMLILGTGVTITGIGLLFSESALVWAPLTVGIIAGIIVLISSESV